MSVSETPGARIKIVPKRQQMADAWHTTVRRHWFDGRQANRLRLIRVGKPLRNCRRVKFALIVVRAHTNHVIAVLDLTGVNGVRLLLPVILAVPYGCTIKIDRL